MGACMSVPLSAHDRAMQESGLSSTTVNNIYNFSTTPSPFVIHVELSSDDNVSDTDESDNYEVILGLSSTLGTVLVLFTGGCIIYLRCRGRGRFSLENMGYAVDRFLDWRERCRDRFRAWRTGGASSQRTFVRDNMAWAQEGQNRDADIRQNATGLFSFKDEARVNLDDVSVSSGHSVPNDANGVGDHFADESNPDHNLGDQLELPPAMGPLNSPYLVRGVSMETQHEDGHIYANTSGSARVERYKERKNFYSKPRELVRPTAEETPRSRFEHRTFEADPGDGEFIKPPPPTRQTALLEVIVPEPVGSLETPAINNSPEGGDAFYTCPVDKTNFELPPENIVSRNREILRRSSFIRRLESVQEDESLDDERIKSLVCPPPPIRDDVIFVYSTSSDKPGEASQAENGINEQCALPESAVSPKEKNAGSDISPKKINDTPAVPQSTPAVLKPAPSLFKELAEFHAKKAAKAAAVIATTEGDKISSPKNNLSDNIAVAVVNVKPVNDTSKELVNAINNADKDSVNENIDDVVDPAAAVSQPEKVSTVEEIFSGDKEPNSTINPPGEINAPAKDGAIEEASSGVNDPAKDSAVEGASSRNKDPAKDTPENNNEKAVDVSGDADPANIQVSDVNDVFSGDYAPATVQASESVVKSSAVSDEISGDPATPISKDLSTTPSDLIIDRTNPFSALRYPNLNSSTPAENSFEGFSGQLKSPDLSAVKNTIQDSQRAFCGELYYEVPGAQAENANADSSIDPSGDNTNTVDPSGDGSNKSVAPNDEKKSLNLTLPPRKRYTGTYKE